MADKLRTCDSSARPLAAPPLGRMVRVHLNLHNGCYVVSRGGRVMGYAHGLALASVRPRVQLGGYARCRAQRKRNVHAYLEGLLVAVGVPRRPAAGWDRVSYNCLTRPPCFYFVANNVCFGGAAALRALPQGEVWVRGAVAEVAANPEMWETRGHAWPEESPEGTPLGERAWKRIFAFYPAHAVVIRSARDLYNRLARKIDEIYETGRGMRNVEVYESEAEAVLDDLDHLLEDLHTYSEEFVELEEGDVESVGGMAEQFAERYAAYIGEGPRYLAGDREALLDALRAIIDDEAAHARAHGAESARSWVDRIGAMGADEVIALGHDAYERRRELFARVKEHWPHREPHVELDRVKHRIRVLKQRLREKGEKPERENRCL